MLEVFGSNDHLDDTNTSYTFSYMNNTSTPTKIPGLTGDQEKQEERIKNKCTGIK